MKLVTEDEALLALKAAIIKQPLVCVNCGWRYPSARSLRKHWDLYGHGPRNVQADAIDRGRASIGLVK